MACTVLSRPHRAREAVRIMCVVLELNTLCRYQLYGARRYVSDVARGGDLGHVDGGGTL